MSKIPLALAALIAVFVVLIGCAPSLPTREPLAVSPLPLTAGGEVLVDNVFVVADASGTTYVEESFPKAKALARVFVASMPEADRDGDGYWASSIAFGGDERRVSPLAPFDRAELAQNIAGLEPLGSIAGRGGLTPLQDVFDEIGAALESRRGSAAVVIFSDGLPDFPERTLAAAEALVTARSGEICIHAVHSRGDPEGEAFFESLARLADCGSLRPAANLTSPVQFMALTHGVFTGDAPSVGAASCSSTSQRQRLSFGFDRAEITSPGSVVLDALADHLNRCEDERVRIDGHTDRIGSESYNRDLSNRRAWSAHRYLIDAGIDPDRLTARGLGEADPRASNATREGRALNRRVDLSPVR